VNLDTMLALRRERLAAGERPLGWKLAFGGAEARAELGLEGPLIGFLTDRSLLDDGGRCDVSGWHEPLLELELAVHVGEDASIAALGPALELADLDSPPDDPARMLAGNIFHRYVVLGPADQGRTTAAGITGRLLVDDVEVASTEEPEALTGELPELIAFVAETLERHGERLAPGDVVIAGSIVPPVSVRAGQRLVGELPPLGKLSVQV
jgi:2-keto-4-pentenoate hydratase